MTTYRRVAVVGLGNMGSAMARKLANAEFEVVVWNRTRSLADEVATGEGVSAVGSLSEVSAGADVIVTSLADDAAVRSVYLGKDGIVASIRPGSVAVDTSTVDPETALHVAAAFAATGASFLDAPVSGSVMLVEAGTLTSMVGGDADALTKARPVLDALSKTVYHMGPNGTGATIKLAVNALIHATNTAISEALVLAEAAGVDRALAYEVFGAGAGGSPFLHYKQAAFLDPENAPVAFSLDLVAKDLRLILALADRVGVSMPQGQTNLDVTKTAIESGYGDRDMSSIAEYLRRSLSP